MSCIMHVMQRISAHFPLTDISTNDKNLTTFKDQNRAKLPFDVIQCSSFQNYIKKACLHQGLSQLWFGHLHLQRIQLIL